MSIWRPNWLVAFFYFCGFCVAIGPVLGTDRTDKVILSSCYWTPDIPRITFTLTGSGLRHNAVIVAVNATGDHLSAPTTDSSGNVTDTHVISLGDPPTFPDGATYTLVPTGWAGPSMIVDHVAYASDGVLIPWTAGGDGYRSSFTGS